ncbi:MAG: universal stress protein [Bdellovibrionales bacterium]|nr:universal stress protein [Bdellovibrionales bacterium]
MYPTQKSKIIWAIDPSHSPEDSKQIINELKIWSHHLSCEIQPVSVFSLVSSVLTLNIDLSWNENYQLFAQNLMTQFLKDIEIKNLLKPKLLFVKTLSTRRLAKELAIYAEKSKATLIVAHTKNRKTTNPFRIGSFSETLMATAKVPVLLLNQKTKSSNKIPTILFPTDFSLKSKNALKNLIPFAKTFNSSILLYNQIEFPNLYMSDFSEIRNANSLNFNALMDEAEKMRQNKARKWQNFLKKEKISSKVITKRQIKYLANEIIEIAEENKVNLIAIGTNSGPMIQSLLGSVTKDILSEASCPVLIFHKPKVIRKHKPLDKTDKTTENHQKRASLKNKKDSVTDEKFIISS